MLGYSREAILRETIMDLILPEEKERLFRHRERFLKSESDVGEWMLRKKDGTYLPVEVSAKILPDGRWQGFVRDITERKRNESEQRLLTEVATALATTLDFDETLTNIARLSVRGMGDFCIIDLVEEDGSIRRARVVCSGPSNTRIADALMRVSDDGEEVSGSRSLRLSNDAVLLEDVTRQVLTSWVMSERHLEMLESLAPRSALAVPLLAHGRLLGRLLLISSGPRRYGPRDLAMAEAIAQRAALSLENARLYRSAKRATEVRDEVMGIVAHDLRNPLQLITTDAEQLRRSGPEQAREIGAEIGAAASRMNRLIADLLDATRLEAGRFSVSPGRLHIAEVISAVVETQAPLVSSRSLELRAAISPDLPEIWADYDRLLQVFENLVGNAMKFTRPGGKITLGADAHGTEIVFSVSDTGSGIPESDLPHVFDRFWQAPKGRHRGAGLGLPIVKGIVEAHGGRVWVQSSVGEGSVFYFTIPTPTNARVREAHAAPLRVAAS
jgi:signal transduction histidine kinase